MTRNALIVGTERTLSHRMRKRRIFRVSSDGDRDASLRNSDRSGSASLLPHSADLF